MEVIDAQIHLWDSDTPRRTLEDSLLKDVRASTRNGFWDFFARHTLTGEDFVRQMDAAGVSGALIATPAVLYRTNDYSMRCFQQFPTRFRIVGIVDRSLPDIEDITARWISEPGMVGIRISAVGAAGAAALDAGEYDSLLRGARLGNVPVCFIAPDNAPAIARIAKRFDDVQFIIDHMGLEFDPLARGVPSADALNRTTQALAALPNVALKLGNMPGLSNQEPPFDDLWNRLYPALDTFGPQRLMWASDHSWYTGLPYRSHVDAVRNNDALSASDRAWLLGGTLRRVYRWSPIVRDAT